MPFANPWPCCGGIFDWDTAEARLAELNRKAEDPNLWSDPQSAQKLMRARQTLERQIGAYRQLERDLDDGITLVELGEAEGDEATVAEGEAALRKLKDIAQKREIEALLSGEADANDTFLEVHAGAGGTESQDWASMLMRMFTRWAEQHDYKVEYLEESPGEEAGIKSATVKISGHNAYGWLKSENGVHRLVRISPFDSNARRHTSFASVNVYPVIDDRIQIDINESDVRGLTLAARYLLSKRTATYVSYTRVTNGDAAFADLNGGGYSSAGAGGLPATSAGADVKIFGVGVIHNF